MTQEQHLLRHSSTSLDYDQAFLGSTTQSSPRQNRDKQYGRGRRGHSKDLSLKNVIQEVKTYLSKMVLLIISLIRIHSPKMGSLNVKFVI